MGKDFSESMGNYISEWVGTIKSESMGTFTRNQHNSTSLQKPPTCANSFDSNKESGFTLLELLVVIVILGLLIGLVAPAVLRQLGHAKQSIAKQSTARIGSVLDLYKLDVGGYPSTQDGLEALIAKPDDADNWGGPYLKSNGIPVDPWGHPYLYQEPSVRSGFDYDLCSLGSVGKSGQPGDPDLICN